MLHIPLTSPGQQCLRIVYKIDISRESPPDGAPETVDTDELTAIQESLNEIKVTMVKKSDIEEIVLAIVSKLKEEIKTEIKEEIK